MSPTERLVRLLGRLDQWNALTPEERTAELQRGGGIVMDGKDYAALVETVLRLDRDRS